MVLNVASYWFALPLINLVNNVSVISNRFSEMVTQKKGHYSYPVKGAWIAS